MQDAPALSAEELARQALADGGADGDPTTPEQPGRRVPAQVARRRCAAPATTARPSSISA
jgi:hypothetical protein